MPAVRAQLENGLRCHQAGQLECAADIYRGILRLDPQHGDALHLLGLVAQQQGRHAEAEISYRKSLEIAPRQAVAHNNLGNNLIAQKRIDEAITHFRHALELNPAYALAHFNLGNALKQREDWDAAEIAYRRALDFNHHHAAAHNNLAHVLMLQNRRPEAVTAFCRAIAIEPNYVAAHINLARAYQQDRDFDSAATTFRRALELQSDNVTATIGLGVIHWEQGNMRESLALLEKAVELGPHDSEAHLQLGNVHLAQRRFYEATDCFENAVTAKPTSVDAHNNLGVTCKERGLLSEAVAHFRRALEINPDCVNARSNLLSSLSYDPDTDCESLFEEHRRFGIIHEQSRPPAGMVHHDRGLDRRLKIGYVSPDFRNHSVAFFLEPILRNHDRGAVETTCYAQVEQPDRRTVVFQSLADHWRNTVGMSATQLADAIRADRIDILVDLAGHTSGNRITVFAKNPAPIQVSYLGYGATTGLRAMDYRLTDAMADPVGTERYYTEQLIRLPGGFCCYQPPENAPPVAPAPVIKNGYVTFGSFNHLSKLSSEVIEAYSWILRKTPHSRLLLKNRAFHEPETCDRYQRKFAALGIEEERLELLGLTGAAVDHLKMYGRVDIALDTFPYTGATTTCEALWMGVPVVTLLGQSFVGRISASLLTQIGLTELITPSREAYLKTACLLANNPEVLVSLRGNLRSMMRESSLGDARGLTHHIESAYRSMWHRWCCEQDAA